MTSGLPITFGPASNGEYDPPALTPAERVAVGEAIEECDDNARRLGVSRRAFLRSACATAVTLLAIDRAAQATTGARPGGRYLIDPQARLDEGAAYEAMGATPFVFDVQGHLLEYDLDPTTSGAWFWGRQFPQAACDDEEDPRACFTMNHFLEEMFIRSDTRMAALSGLPILPEGSPLPPEVMEETRRVVQALGRDERLVVNALVLPQLGSLEAVFEEMDRTVAENTIAGWKTFTHFPAAWRFDDADPSLPQVGDRFLQKVVDIGVPRVFVHKGLADRSRSGSPHDIGAAAVRHPDVDIIVYHSGFEVGVTEGPYTDATAASGVNRLVESLARNGVAPGSNVYAEIGTTWWHLMKRPTEAAHLLGKLLVAVGEDNLLWGTDSIFYGSPQGQIDALKAFEITPEFQERFGYPDLTPKIKRKILGENAARMYGVDPVLAPLHYSAADLTAARSEHPVDPTVLGPQTSFEVADFRAHHRGWP